MDKITTVSLIGFKGQAKSYFLQGPTVLSGPNGEGKSAVIEGLTYALSGRVPSGKSLDEVAKYFSAAGGSVTVSDAAGRCIQRGISRAKGGKLTETLTTSDTPAPSPEDENPAVVLDNWKASDVVLDLREFLALSPNKRREFVLRLCSSGAVDLEVALDYVADQYAQSLGGSVAKAANLESPGDFPEELQPQVRLWHAERGVLASLEAVSATSTDDPAELFARLLKVAKDAKSSSRRARDEARAAAEELETQVEGARVAAAELGERKLAAAEAAERLTAAREARAGVAGKIAALEEARSRIVVLNDDPGKLRFRAGDDVKMQGGVDRRQKVIREIDAALQKRAQLETDLSREKTILPAAESDLRSHEGLAIGRLVHLVAEIPDDADPRMADIRVLMKDVAAGWANRLKEYKARVAESKARIARLEKEIEARKKADETRVICRAEKAKAIADLEDRLVAYRKWAEAQRHRQLQAKIETLQAEITEEDADSPDQVAAAEVAHYEAQEALRAAQGAAGKVEAYEQALDRAEAKTVEYDAWSCTERAIKAAREVYVADTVEPLLAVIDETLRLCGRPEGAYCELLNRRGTPIFDIGWTRGGAGIPVQALSGGESVIFCAALSLAIASKSAGRKVLLIEADPLDIENLGDLLLGLRELGDTLDALVVVTSTETGPVEGWNVIEFGGEKK